MAINIILNFHTLIHYLHWCSQYGQINLSDNKNYYMWYLDVYHNVSTHSSHFSNKNSGSYFSLHAVKVLTAVRID